MAKSDEEIRKGIFIDLYNKTWWGDNAVYQESLRKSAASADKKSPWWDGQIKQSRRRAMVLKGIEFAAMVLAVAGVCLNNGQIIWCFPVWMVSNILCAYLHGRAGLKWLLLRDVIFTVLAAVGWVMWAGNV
jgi:hypothetical protein